MYITWYLYLLPTCPAPDIALLYAKLCTSILVSFVEIPFN